MLDDSGLVVVYSALLENAWGVLVLFLFESLIRKQRWAAVWALVKGLKSMLKGYRMPICVQLNLPLNISLQGSSFVHKGAPAIRCQAGSINNILVASIVGVISGSFKVLCLRSKSDRFWGRNHGMQRYDCMGICKVGLHTLHRLL